MTRLRIAVPAATIAVTLVLVGAASLRLAIALSMSCILVMAIATRPRQCVTLLFLSGALLLDFSPLPVYRYFLLSDLLLLTACILQFGIERRLIVYVPILFMFLSLGYLAASLVAFGASQDYSGLSNWLHFAFLMLVFVPLLTTLFVRRPELAAWLAGAIVVTVLLQSLILFGEIANGLEWRVGTRIPGALGTTGLWNYVAAVVALTGIAASASWPTRLRAGIALTVIALAEMFLRSRMLWLSSMLGAGLMFSVHRGRRIQGLIFVAGVALVGTIGYLAQWYPEAIQRRIAETLRPTESADLVARLQVVRELAGAIEQSAGLGIGVGQSETYLHHHHSTAVVVTVHNIVLHAAVEGGVVAATCVLLMPIAIFVLWRSAARAARTPLQCFLLNWEVSSLLAIYVGAQLTPSLYEHAFYVILAALAAAGCHGRETATSRSMFLIVPRILGLQPTADSA